MYCEDQYIPYEAVKQLGSGKILILAPHPDDEIFGCAGAIMKHVESGDPVQVVIVSDGGYLESGSKEEYIQRRKQESIQAGKLLGYTPEFWDIPDREVVYGEKLIARIGDEIDTAGIDFVYAPSVTEIHPDHRSLGMTVAEAVRRSEKKIRVAFYEVGVPLHPNRLLDITEVMALKQKAMACFTSQLQQQKYDRHIAALNQFRTYTLPPHVQAAEAYFITDSEQLAADPLTLYHSKAEKITFPGPNVEASQNNLVTVIIRSVGREKLLAEALDSVALQTYPHIEVLVVNAKGGGHPALEQWCGRFPLRICGTGEPLTRCRAANLGLENARGDYLIFLDDDDLFDPDHVVQLVKALRDRKGYLAAYAGVRVSANQTLSKPPDRKVYNDPYDAARLLCHNYIPLHAVLFSRQLIGLGCRFDESLSLCEDWDFWLQAARHTHFFHVDRISATYRIGEEGSTIWQDKENAKKATMKILEKWAPSWPPEQLFTIAYRAGALHDYEIQARQFSTREQEQTKQMVELHTSIQRVTKQRDAITMERDALAAERDTLVAERDTLITERGSLIAERNSLAADVSRHREELATIYASKSWRLTAGFRKARRVFSTKILPVSRRLFSKSCRFLWTSFPISIERKLAFKEKLFKSFPFIFKKTAAYQNWQGSNIHQKSYTPETAPIPTKSLKDIIDNTKHTYVPITTEAPYSSRTVRLIAFYLPQFHPIPENDAWWGKGFTEWTNVKAAKPQFAGHYQPRIPGDLGYYDLCADPVIMERQVELAKLHGLEGFCFYFYWFNGKRLLESPVLSYLEKKELDFPFCLCWANENWSRRWDGLDHEILISQKHSPEDDLAFIEYTAKYFQDRRYIRVKGKPLLLVYRPSLLPSARKTANRWRQWCRDHGIGEIFLAYTQSFEAVNPEKYGFDAAIEFPPNLAGIQPLAGREKELFHQEFGGVVYDLGELAKRSDHYSQPDYPLFRSVCPSWDNTARRGKTATIFVNDSPASYRQWLSNAAIDTASRFKQKDTSLVFVNAWNEWAEGAYLEPDQARGYAYLQATRDALVQADSHLGRRRILLVAHDAHPHGAQSLILHMAKVLHDDFFFAVDMVVLGNGILLAEYARYATVHSLEGKNHDGREARALAADLFSQGIHAAICNTTVTGIFAKTLKEQGFRIVSLIHELTKVIKDNNLQPQVQAIASHADYLVFPARQVMEGFASMAQKPLPETVIRPQGLYKKNSLSSLPAAENKKNLRVKLGLSPEAKIVLAIAFGDHRKGIDLFVEAGLLAAQEKENIYFVWVGRIDSAMEQAIKEKLSASDFSHRFIFPGMDFQTDIYYAGADIYALTSREDPFPSVVLEALDASTPVIAFAGIGGCGELLSRNTGSLVPPFDTQAYAREIIDLLEHPETLHTKGAQGREIITREFSFRQYLFDLLDLAGCRLKKVSVIVPNYNYAKYLPERLNSIVQQTYPLYEIIVLDDASTDESVELLEKLIPELNAEISFVAGKANSGSPFRQWLKGVELARGDYVWIAEADDLASPEFLEEAITPFSDQQVVMSYCQSKQITATGKTMSNHYLDYVADISPEKWLDHYTVDGVEEIKSGLAVKNTVPNVSGVIFQRKRLLQILRDNINEIAQYRVAGDWLTYLLVLQEGKISFSPKALNAHRRHQESITLGSFNISQLKEILAVQKKTREMFPLDGEIIEKAQTYSQQLYENFGLASEDTPLLRDNPELKKFLC